MNLKEKISGYRLVPVLNIADVNKALALAEVLLEEGLAVMELTFRNSSAAGVMAEVRRRFPAMLLGAGTVRNAGQLRQALDAGADFIVSPSLVPEVLEDWQALPAAAASPDGREGSGRTPYIPGICTPRELEEVLAAGIGLVKFFPAEAAGGIPMLKALGATHPEVSFMPTGGISLENAASYLRLKNVFACGASSIVPADALEKDDFVGIRESIRQHQELIKSL